MAELHVSVELPVFDLSQPVNLSFLSSLSQACQEWGFFYVTNHGISRNLFSKVCTLSKHIFSLPKDSKLKVGPSSCLKTYTPHFIASPYFESLIVSGPDFYASAKRSADELFSQQNSEFSEILQEYGNKMIDLSKRIIEVLVMTLGDGCDRKFCESEFSNCHGYFRVVNYSPPKDVEEREVEGLGMHTDMSCITIVYQDETGGLQMRSKEGEWLDIPPCEDLLVVNIGDLMQAWSNGRLRSSEHRVVLKRLVNRLSLAFFWCFEDEKVILAPDEVLEEGDQRIYKSFVCLDYLRFRESNEEGKFEKIGYTVKDFAGLTLQT
ncbi:PREDICTED: feruloyl CoA ortho-hydroxylase 2-like isoform X1 [Populus euphratica]|uniref:Feruloyl CoA ortho-hydroxylase 2-like isoform X1 n=1 Tax=Populus euphratica TaxID=75702 RepID=A0AAJ6U503_POPEU|nr:PREDICTED: feruloyl CoA ortho-hydroxylase 2-like isoform X1 [Populus euphratica]XP_011022681.1 PREDICTED: feruloyl CoA ortho-hydroxylase 2-like isoform X1 [Populus euphratica]